MPLMPRAGFARMVLLLWSALLVGCAHSPAPPRGNATARLYTRALQEIGLVYIAPVSDQKLMLAGLAGLSRLDRKLSIAETPAPAQQIGIALTYGGRQLALYALPRESDEAGWGLLA
ncbi:MAG: hypothetical protein ACREFK_14050, partial [Stellaceae bacterium]